MFTTVGEVRCLEHGTHSAQGRVGGGSPHDAAVPEVAGYEPEITGYGALDVADAMLGLVDPFLGSCSRTPSCRGPMSRSS